VCACLPNNKSEESVRIFWRAVFSDKEKHKGSEKEDVRKSQIQRAK